jgi:arsenate reductase
MAKPRSFAFVCLHGSAKSVIAAEYLQQAARARGIEAQASAAGQEPDDALPPHVLKGMRERGFDLEGRAPRAVTAEALAKAEHIVSFGCDLSSLAPGRKVERWDDVPAVSDGFDPAWKAITAKVDRLLEE